MTIVWETPHPGSGTGVAKFLPLLRKAVAAAEDRPDLKLQFARALFESGQTVELIDLLKPLLTDEDAPPELLFWLGRAAMAHGDDPMALVALRSAAAKRMANAFDFLAKVLARLGREDEALDAGLEALKRAPMNSPTLRIVAAALCSRGETERLWNLCVDLRSRGEQSRLLSAVMVSTAAMLDYETELEKLMDRSKWFFAGRLAVSEGFNRNLAAEILAERSAKPIVTGKATRGAGSRVDHFERVEGPHAQYLMGKIRAAVDDYVAERERFSSDPIMADHPAAVTLESWALAVNEDGHTAWHIHPHGWISGVYYVDMPKLEPAADPSGAIEFGPFPLGGNTQALKPHCWHVMPAPSVLLLFPSYYAHRTLPTGVTAPRICVAFDVRPSQSGSTAAEQRIERSARG